MNRISRCTSRMCSRPVRAGSTVSASSPAGVLVAVPAPDALVAAGAERPAAVPRRRSVAGQEHAPDVGRLAGVVEGLVQLVDRVGPEGVAHLGAVEGHPDRPLVHRPVVGDVGEIEAVHLLPGVRIEDRRDMDAETRGPRRRQKADPDALVQAHPRVEDGVGDVDQDVGGHHGRAWR